MSSASAVFLIILSVRLILAATLQAVPTRDIDDDVDGSSPKRWGRYQGRGIVEEDDSQEQIGDDGGFRCGDATHRGEAMNRRKRSTADLNSLLQGGRGGSAEDQANFKVKQLIEGEEAEVEGGLRAQSAGAGDAEEAECRDGRCMKIPLDLCEETQELVYPLKGKNFEGEERVIMQIPPTFRQPFHFTSCRTERCNVVIGECVQTTSFQRAAVTDPNDPSARVFYDWFKIPTGCGCKAAIWPQ